MVNAMMAVEDSETIRGVKIITPRIHRDHRGENLETYNQEGYRELKGPNGTELRFVLDAISASHKNVLRGMHGDMVTDKLIQCLYGRIYLVVADIRRDEPSFMKWESFVLDDMSRQQVLVPRGCLNGHLCLSDVCVFSYKKTEYYRGQESETVMAWNSPELEIYWPTRKPIVSRRDDGR